MSKSRKESGKKDTPKPRMFNWDEASEDIGKRVSEFMNAMGDDEDEEEGSEPVIPYAPSGDHAVDSAVPIPVAPTVMPAVPARTPEGSPAMVRPPEVKPAEGKGTEGRACALHRDMKPLAPQSGPMMIKRARVRSSLNPGPMNTDQLRRALVMSEVIGKPVALRKRASAR
ncbi:MAG: hypothetical protein Q4A66_12955 [Eubacteriales bacterium]|nr:hypothetical protein [Eubacteriales bacterium]